MKMPLCLLLMIICSCSLFKHTRTDTKQSRQLSTREKNLQSLEKKDWLSKSGSVNFYKDTGNVSYAIRIWPKGTFSFSPGNGFSGEADQVMIEGNSTGSSVLAGSTITKQQNKGILKTTLSQSEKQVADEKEKLKESLPSWKLVVAGLVLVLLLSSVLYKKLTRKFTI